MPAFLSTWPSSTAPRARGLVFATAATGGRARAIVAAVLVASSPLVMRVATALWSELPFLLVSALLLHQLARLAGRPTIRRPAVTAMLTAALVMLRYVGLVWVLVGMAVTAIAFRRRSARYAAACVAVYAAAAVGPLALWVRRNLEMTGTVAGHRPPGTDTLVTSIVETARNLVTTLLPSRVVTAVPDWLAVLAAAAVAALLAWPLVARRRSRVEANHGATAGMIAGSLSLLYLAGLLLASRSAMDPIDWRLLSPLAVPLSVLGALAWHTATERARHAPSWRRHAATVIVAMVVVFQARHSLTLMAGHAPRQLAQRQEVAGSATLQAAAALPPSTVVLSNVPTLVYRVRSRQVERSPRLRHYRSRELAFPQNLNALRRRHPPGTRAYIVWFKGIRGYVEPATLGEHLSLREIADFHDGAIYEATF